MMRHHRTRHLTVRVAAVLGLGVAALASCDQVPPLAPAEAAAPGEITGRPATDPNVDPALCALDRRDFTLKSRNEYYPLGVGSRWVLRGTEEGKQVELRVTVLHETEVVGGVRTRVVEERHYEDGALVEHSRNFIALTKEGSACYFGEDVDIYEDGEIVAHTGAWRADAPGNRPGLLMPAHPQVGMVFRMEGAPGVAMDVGEVVAMGSRVSVFAGTFKNTVRIRETDPLTGDSSEKDFAQGVGIVVDGPMSLVRYSVTRGGVHGGGDDDEDDEDDDG